MIGRFASGGPREETYGYSRAVRTVAGLLDPEMLVEVEREAHLG